MWYKWDEVKPEAKAFAQNEEGEYSHYVSEEVIIVGYFTLHERRVIRGRLAVDRVTKEETLMRCRSHRLTGKSYITQTDFVPEFWAPYP